jgi:MFS family permease
VSSGPTDSSTTSSRRAWWVLGAMCLPLLAQSLDVSGIGLLLPSIGTDLGAGPTALGWVMNANPLAFGALLLTAGWVADRFGPRALLLGGVGAFGVASALCAIAPSTGFLVAARAAQGLASAACFTTSLAVVSATFDERRRPGAIGAWGAVSGAGSAFGPLLAGALAATLGWRWFFVINAPLCLLAVPVIAVLTRPSASTAAAPTPAAQGARAPRIGLAAVAVGFVALSLAVGSSVSAAARLVPALLAVAALTVLWCGRRNGRPVVEPAALAGPWSRAALAVGFSSTWAFGVVLVIGSALLQQVRGMGPMAAGATFLAFSGAFALAGAAVGRLVRRAGVGTTMGVGMALTVVGLGSLALLPADVGLAAIVAALVVGGLGQGLAFDGSTTASLAGVPGRSTGEATASVQTLRLLGSVLGVAASTAIVATAAAGASTSEIADLQRLAFALAAVVAVSGSAALAALRPTRRATAAARH